MKKEWNEALDLVLLTEKSNGLTYKQILKKYPSMFSGFSEINLRKRVYNLRKNIKKPRIFIYDIETSPVLAYVWGLYNQNINTDDVINDWMLLSWAGKWYNEPGILGDCLKREEVLRKDDRRVVKSLWNTLKDADITIAYNGQDFDEKRVNTRFLIHNLPPLVHKVIDPLKVIRKKFSFSSNKLDYINKQLELGRKGDVEHEDWLRCLGGDTEALTKLHVYNKRDVEILEQLYKRLLGWIDNHPDVRIYSDGLQNVCPNCGSKYIQQHGDIYTNYRVYIGYRCLICGRVFKGKLKKTK